VIQANRLSDKQMLGKTTARNTTRVRKANEKSIRKNNFEKKLTPSINFSTYLSTYFRDGVSADSILLLYCLSVANS